MINQKTWREVNAIYQIYPRSFHDSDGDGVGDIGGIIDKLDYLKGQKNSLGVDAIWLSPIYTSPMSDMGYDISNYVEVDEIFGTLDDFRQLVEKSHDLGIKVMVDFVPNHSSDQHKWFRESRKKSLNQYTDYYTWRDAKPDGSPPNNWLSIFGGSAWEWDDERQQYYLHTFLREQPDLNWDNPMVREEMKQVIRFWFDIGVDGIRADAVRWLSKDPEFRDDIYTIEEHEAVDGTHGEYDHYIHKYSRFGDSLFDYLRELTDVVEGYDDRIMVFEDYPDSSFSTEEQYLGFYGINPRVSMPFNFEGIWTIFDAGAFRDFIVSFQGMINQDEHVPVYCFSNHDQSRIVSRVGGDDQARLLALMQLSLPGLPTVYYGDEIAMSDVELAPEEIRDSRVLSSGDVMNSRDGARTPMQWQKGQNAGFSNTKPWLPIGKDLRVNNVETQLSEPDSMLSLYRRLLKLRRDYQLFRTGSFETFSEASSSIFAFARRLGDQHAYVVLNFSGEPQDFQLPHGGRIVCCTHPVDYPELSREGSLNLRPYEGAIIECEEHPLVRDAQRELDSSSL